MNVSGKVSIVVPIYNVEKYLRQCLESIVNQTYRNLEIILVDDGSPDGCGMICDEYAKKDSRVIVVHQENQGVSVARNVGIEMATGEWIMFVDPDDWLELECCEKVIECVFSKPWDIVYFRHIMHDEKGTQIEKIVSIGSFALTNEMVKKLQLEGLAGRMGSLGFNAMVPWGKIYRKEFLVQYGCKFPAGIKKRQDSIFNLYCLEYTKWAYCLDFAGYNYRVNFNSICWHKNEEMMNILLVLLQEAEKFVCKYHPNDKEYARALGIFTISIHNDLKKTLFFRLCKDQNYKEFRKYLDNYYNHGTVKQYSNKCSMRDFPSVKSKINFWLISGRHVCLYYYVLCIYQYVIAWGGVKD